MILRGNVVHAVSSVAVFPAVGNTVAIRVWMCWVSNTTKAPVEILALKRIDFIHPLN